MRKGALLFLIAAWVALLAACGGAESYDEPPEIIYGQDVCSNCNMIISEENYASAYWTAEGEARRFDDMGEMLAYIQSSPEERASTWVHDVNTAAWLRAEDAWIVMNAGLMTPMGTGIVAVANEEDARALAFDQEGAMVLTFAELMDKLEAGELMLGMGH
jgi:copper chaperone NosL